MSDAGFSNENEINEPSSKSDMVSDYLTLIDRWTNGIESEDAFLLDDIRERRVKLAASLSEKGLVSDDRLIDVKLYLGADVAEAHKTDEREEDYADDLRRRTLLRERLFGEEVDITTDLYIESTKTAQGLINTETEIRGQYEVLDVRRDVVQQHYDDADFIAEIAILEDNHLRDELLLDLDRGDLDSRQSKSRTKHMADTFRKSVVSNLDVTASSAKKVSEYMVLRGMASEMVVNQDSIIGFSRSVHDIPNVGTEDKAAFGVGMSAFRTTRCNVDTLAEVLESINSVDRDAHMERASKDPVALFDVARRKFENDLANPTDANSNIAGSYAAMEFAADKIFRMGSKTVGRVFEGPDGHVNGNAFMQFEAETRAKNHKIGSIKVTEAAFDAYSKGDEEALRTVEDAKKDHKERERNPVIVADVRGEETVFTLGNGEVPEVEVSDGSHIVVRVKNDGFRKTQDAYILADKTGFDLSDPSVMKKFLGSDGNSKDEKSKSKDKQDDQEFFAAASIAGLSVSIFSDAKLTEDDLKLLTNSNSSKSKRTSIALRLGLGEAVLIASGLDVKEFSKLASGRTTVEKFSERVALAGFSQEDLERLNLTPDALKKVADQKSDKAGIIAYQAIIEKSANFRLEGIVAPPVGTMTEDGKIDAGLEAKSKLEQILAKNRTDDGNALLFDFKKSADGKENVVSVNLRDGRYLSDVMLSEGYAVPLAGESRNRKENLAQKSEVKKKGLWAYGMPELDDSWRRDVRSPALTAHDKKEHLFKSVGASMAGTASDARRLLSDRGIKIFALPLEPWSKQDNVIREISKVTEKDPSKVLKVYNGNMEILRDLRERNKKGTLTDDEKLAHDRLSVGRRALAESLVENELMTKEEAQADSHKLLSRKAGRSGAFREKFVKTTAKALDVGVDVGKSAGRGLRQLTESSMSILDV